MLQLKIYDGKNRLWTSKKIDELSAAKLLKIMLKTVGISSCYVKKGTTVKQISVNLLSTAESNEHSTVYIDQNGTRSFTIPISLDRYPIIIKHY